MIKSVCGLVVVFVSVLMLFAVFPAGSDAKISKCGVSDRNLCLEYETEHVKVGESQVYTIVGGVHPFEISFVQNGDKVRLERIGDRSFRLTGVKETTGFGVGPVQFYVNETRGYKQASGNGFLNISPAVGRPAGGTQGKPPAVGSGHPAARTQVSGRQSLEPGWETFTATGKGTGFEPGGGQSVVMTDNILQVFQAATNRGGAVVTKPIIIQAGKKLRITKETMVHFAGDHYTGMTAVLGQDPAKDVLSAVGYYRYEAENYFGAGFLKTQARTRPVWDVWFREVIVYDPGSGKTVLSVNNGPELVYQGRPASGAVRVGLHAYGWGTGHFQKVRYFSLEWID